MLKLTLDRRRGPWCVHPSAIESFHARTGAYGQPDGSVVRTVTGDTKIVEESPDEIEKLMLK